MGEKASFTSLDRRLRNRVEMTRRHGLAAECEVALGADKRRALVPLVYLVVENSTVVERRGNVATFGAATRFHRNFLRLVIGRIQRRHVVTLCALQIRVRFVAKRAG